MVESVKHHLKEIQVETHWKTETLISTTVLATHFRADNGFVVTAQSAVKSNLVLDSLIAKRRARVPTVEPTHLKNMRKSNWIISPGIGVKIPKLFELPPPSTIWNGIMSRMT